MGTLSLVAVMTTTVFVGVRYSYLIITQRIKPALAMWVFFLVAVLGSLMTYLAEGDFRLRDNLLNVADVVLVSVILVVTLIFGDRSTRFTRFDLGCTGAVLAIIAFWAITGSHLLSNLAIQSILVIAYFPVVKRLWSARENTESFAAWIAMTMAPLFSLLSSRGFLASVYAVRAMICTSLLLLLMTRVHLRAKALGKAQGAAETTTLSPSSPSPPPEG